jgi:hypothetical protein
VALAPSPAADLKKIFGLEWIKPAAGVVPQWTVEAAVEPEGSGAGQNLRDCTVA